MANDFYIKQHDTRPALQRTLLDATGTAIDISGSSVRFHMKSRTANVLNAAAAVVNGPGGVVQYSWAPADTAARGIFMGEFEVTFADTTVETFPNTDFMYIHIDPDVV